MDSCWTPQKPKLWSLEPGHYVAKFDSTAGISIGDTTVKISTAIRVLGVTIHRHSTFVDHLTKVVSSCNYHIRSLRHIRHLIDRETANTTACSAVDTRLDYCNAVLYGITGKNVMSCNLFRTLWPELSVLYHFAVNWLHYFAPCTGFRSDTDSPTKLLH